MGKDKRGISRVKCSICECEEFESSALRCGYCGHTPMDHLPFGSERERPRTEDQFPLQNVPQPEESTGFIERQMHEVSTESAEAEVDVCEKSDEVVVTSVKTHVQAQRSDSVDTAVKTLQKQIHALTSEKGV